MKTDRNGDGKHDWTDDYMDYKMSSSSSSSSGSGNRPVSSSGSFKIPTWLLVVAVLGIVSGDLPINGFTVVLAVIMAVVVWIRIIS